MPTLDWIGKKAVVSHHREVPFHLLKTNDELSVGDPGSGNLVVQGDNPLALKALLPHYAGKVKCIYIDPPYNTGNENWTYNDNVNSPEIRQWLGKVVGGEMEDLSRHDKWLCMMYPRLCLLREMLRDDGALFISIDEFEIERLKSLIVFRLRRPKRRSASFASMFAKKMNTSGFLPPKETYHSSYRSFQSAKVTCLNNLRKPILTT